MLIRFMKVLWFTIKYSGSLEEVRLQLRGSEAASVMFERVWFSLFVFICTFYVLRIAVVL